MKLNIKVVRPVVVFCTLAVFSLMSGCWAAPLTIADNGKSTFSIVVPDIAAKSVNDAAAEMQLDINEATGVKLPIVKDNTSINGSFISLGTTRQAKQANITTKGLAYDDFRTVTKNGNLYIIGIDTTAETSSFRGPYPRKVTLHPEIPGSSYTRKGGFSTGTANGVYSFLENQLGVRWLFPGDLGRVVPTKSTFIVNDLDRTVTPAFNFRILDKRTGSAWSAKQKLGTSVNIQVQHAFRNLVPASMWKEHPEWFPLLHGKRVKPPARGYKLETTNQELVEFIADKAVDMLEKDSQLYAVSLSPSDGGGWSQSAESKAFYDPIPKFRNTASVTPLVLKFYRDVSAIVAKENPQGNLTGYLYGDYVYPPVKGKANLPANFIPMYATRGNRYKFYNQAWREIETKNLNAWAKIKHPDADWYAFSFVTWLRRAGGMVLPAQPKALNFFYHNLLRVDMKGAEVYPYGSSSSATGHGAMIDYINAKMLWNPKSDATWLQHDWLIHAYGSKAGAIMETLYNKLDESWWSGYFRSPQYTTHGGAERRIRYTFGRYYPQMEELFLKAWNEPMTDKQRKRLDIIRSNMIALQFRLHNAGYLPADYQSPLTKTATQVYSLFTDAATTHDFPFGIVLRGSAFRKRKSVVPVKVRLEKSPSATSKSIPNRDHVMFYSTKDQTVHITPFDVLPKSNFVSYYVQNSEGNVITQGLLYSGDEITFKAKKNSMYYFSTYAYGIYHNSDIKWKMRIPGAAISDAAYYNNTLYLSPESKGSLYVFVPDGMHLQVKKSKNGSIVQTETEEVAKTRKARALRRVTRTILENTSKKYQADQLIRLNHKWRFTPDPQNQGASKGYYKTDFDDSSWKAVNTVSYWQMQGFPEYHGTAWYRRAFNISESQVEAFALGGRHLLLFFGNIDGDAVIYVNGTKIEDRIMGHHSQGWAQPLVYDINNLVHTGENTIAVKVTKDRLAAGLYHGVSILEGIMPKK